MNIKNSDRIVVTEERNPTVVEDLEGDDFLTEEPPEITAEAVEDANANIV